MIVGSPVANGLRAPAEPLADRITSPGSRPVWGFPRHALRFGPLEEQQAEGGRILSKLLQAREIVQAKDGARKVAVGEMVGLAAAPIGDAIETAPLTKDKADGYLRQLGILVAPPFFYIAHSSGWVGEQLADTPFADGWRIGLQTLPDVGPGS